MQSEQLWEYFVVAGLPKVGLQTVQGDAGFLGTDQKYKPVFVDSLPHSTFDESCHLPPQLPTVSVCVCVHRESLPTIRLLLERKDMHTPWKQLVLHRSAHAALAPCPVWRTPAFPCLQCCLPAGVDIVLHQDLDKADLTPHTFACVLTGQQLDEYAPQCHCRCVTPLGLSIGCSTGKSIAFQQRPQQHPLGWYCCCCRRGWHAGVCQLPDLLRPRAQ